MRDSDAAVLPPPLSGVAYAPPTVHHHCDQIIQPLRVGGVPGGVEEAELQGEDDAIGQFGVALQLLHVLKALQVQSQDHRQLLYTHPVTTERQQCQRHGRSAVNTDTKEENLN